MPLIVARPPAYTDEQLEGMTPTQLKAALRSARDSQEEEFRTLRQRDLIAETGRNATEQAGKAIATEGTPSTVSGARTSRG